MAAEQYEKLLELGVFKGLDATKAGTSVEPGHAIQATNCNPSIIEDALTPERGRLQAYDFAAHLDSVLMLFSGLTYNAGMHGPSYPIYIAGGIKSGVNEIWGYAPGLGTAVQFTYAGTAPATLAQFDQAVQYGGVLYMNNGYRIFLNTTNLGIYAWQYPPPGAIAGTNFTATDAGAGTLVAGTYYYVITRTYTMPDGTISETSIDLGLYANPAQVTLTTMDNILITPSAGLVWSGTSPLDGNAFTTNLYRQSSNQPTYFFVANLTGSGAYTDNSPDSTIVNNAQLVPQRDAPPLVPGSYGVGATTYNFGALAIHKGRVWVYLIAEDTETLGVPQVQLWYSNLGRPWEFDQLTQVLLLDSDVVNQYAAPPNANATYTNLYGNDPLALAEVGSLLLALSRRQTWAVYGDAPTTFIARQIFNIGTVSRHSVTPALGGVFWLSENGAYYFDGSTPSYISEGIRGILTEAPNSPAITAHDQSMTTGFFSNSTWYLAFPTLGYTLPYFTIDAKWLGSLLFAPFQPAAVAYTLANPSQYSLPESRDGGLNEVIAVRQAGGTAVDWWFVNADEDLGGLLTFEWVGPYSVSSKPSYEKQYRFLTVHVPPFTYGSAIISLTVDGVQQPGNGPAGQTWYIPDLSVSTRHITSLGFNGGLCRGFMGQLSITVTGVVGKPSPQIWNVICWGQQPPDRNLELRV